MRRRAQWNVLLLAVLSTCGAAAAADLAPVQLKARTFVPSPGLDAIDVTAAGPRHVFVQLSEPFRPELRTTLAAAGLHLLRYVPTDTWIATVTPRAASTPSTLALLAWAGEIRPADKAPARLFEGRARASARRGDRRLELRVRFHDDVDVADASVALTTEGAEILAPMSVFPGATVLAPEWIVPALAALDVVMWITEGLPEPILDNDGSRATTGADVAQASPYELSGLGVHLGIWDGGRVDPGHDDFAGRLTIVDSGDISTHATHVAGTSAGSGALSAANGGTPFQWRGMAPAASIFSWDFNGDIPAEIESGVGTFDLDLETNSWGYGVDGSNCEDYGDYDGLAPEFDAIVRGSGGRKLTVTFSAGNERDDGDCALVDGAYGCLNQPKPAKNIIVVGATNSDDDTMTGFSSWGPTDDGRLKPDVTAPGCERGGERYVRSTLPGDIYGGPGWCGTSMAAPAAAGNLALLVQLYRAVTGLETPEPSLMKALLVSTSDDLGNPYPDYAFGHGRVNAPAAANVLLDDTPSVFSVDHGEVTELSFRVPPGTPRLRFALVWDDPDAAPLSSPALVNDLDLELIAPGSNTVHPWVLDPADPAAGARRGVDGLNNVEHITIELPFPGMWTARVTGTNVPDGPQIVSLVGLDTNAPAAPAGFEVVGATSTSLDLTWTSASASDRTGTLIVRDTDGTGWAGPEDGATYTIGQAVADGVQVIYVADVDHSVDPFTDTGLASGVTYTYGAYSFDDRHNYSSESSASGTTGTTVAVDALGGLAARFQLHVARPNPARAGTSIGFDLDETAMTRVRIYDAGGRHVRTLVHETLTAGTYRVDWDGRDATGLSVSPGVYFYELSAAAQRDSRRLVWAP